MTDPGYKASAQAANINVATLAFDWSAAAALVAAGDFAIIGVSSTAAVDTPSGWAPSGTPTTVDGRLGRLTAFTKTLVAGDLTGAATFTLTAGGDATTDWAAAIWIGGPGALDVVMTKDETLTTGTAVVAPSISPVSTNTRLVTMHGTIAETGGQQPTGTADALMTERQDVTGVSGSLRNAWLLVADQLVTAAGATGTRTATSSFTVRRAGLSFVVAASASNTLAPAKMTLAMTSTSPTLTQASNGNLAPAKMTLAMTSTSPTLVAAGNGTLTVAKMTLAMTSTSPTLTQASNGNLAPAKMTLAMTSTSPTLAPANLAPAKLTLAMTMTSPTLAVSAQPDPPRDPIRLSRALASDGPLTGRLGFKYALVAGLGSTREGR